MKAKLKFALLALIAIFACTELTPQATAAKRKTKAKTKQTTTTAKQKKATSSEKDKMDKLLEKAKNNPDEITDEEAELLGALFLAGMFNEYSNTEKEQQTAINDPVIQAAPYTPKVETFYVKGVRFDMVEVQGGTFHMGATSEQGSDVEVGENHVHSVTLDSYYIGKTEVTQALWEAIMGSNPANPYIGSGKDFPVTNVSWYACKNFIKKLNTLTGKRFRLPTEAEWEFACRGGNNSRGYKYSGSNDIEDVAWFDDGTDARTGAVGSKDPNELGIFDMSGNVEEWCADWYGSYSSKAQKNPAGPTSGTFRVVRGGSWESHPRNLRSSRRSLNSPELSFNSHGLRLAL